MKIIPLPKSKHLTGGWFDKGLKEFEALINERIVDCKENNNKKKTEGELPDGNKLCGGCCLGCCIEQFYFYDSSLTHIPAYKNAIWIKVYNLNGINIWLRVGFNKNGRKKVEVYSECDLDCIKLSVERTYALPPDFINNGIIWREKHRVAMVSFSDIIDRICNLLDCLCVAKCK